MYFLSEATGRISFKFGVSVYADIHFQESVLEVRDSRYPDLYYGSAAVISDC
jgi:hypothetical protein